MSIADSTACSASSEYGGLRSRKGSRPSGGVIEYSTDELDIFPGGPLPTWISQQSGWVVRDDERNAVKAMDLTPELPDGKLRLEQGLRRERTQRKNRLRTNQLKLAKEIRAASGYFVR